MSADSTRRSDDSTAAQRREELQPEMEQQLRHLGTCLRKLAQSQRSLVEGYYYERAGVEKLAERSQSPEAIRLDQWRMASARLDQDPSLVVHLDLEGLSDSDWTLRNASDKNQSVQDATIAGCHRAEGRWQEKQALEFQGVNDRVQLAVPGNFESLTLAAWVRVQDLDRQFNSLFMTFIRKANRSQSPTTG